MAIIKLLSGSGKKVEQGETKKHTHAPSPQAPSTQRPQLAQQSDEQQNSIPMFTVPMDDSGEVEFPIAAYWRGMLSTGYSLNKQNSRRQAYNLIAAAIFRLDPRWNISKVTLPEFKADFTKEDLQLINQAAADAQAFLGSRGPIAEALVKAPARLRATPGNENKYYIGEKNGRLPALLETLPRIQALISSALSDLNNETEASEGQNRLDIVDYLYRDVYRWDPWRLPPRSPYTDDKIRKYMIKVLTPDQIIDSSGRLVENFSSAVVDNKVYNGLFPRNPDLFTQKRK